VLKVQSAQSYSQFLSILTQGAQEAQPGGIRDGALALACPPVFRDDTA
jgi:hypothetical protein